MLSGQPNHGSQLCFPFQLHAGMSDFRLYDSSDLKTYLLMRRYGPDAFAVVRPTLLYPWYEVYRGYIVFAFSVIMFVCLSVCLSVCL